MQAVLFWSLLTVILLISFNYQRIRYWLHLLMEQGYQTTVHYDRCLQVLESLYQDVNAYAISMHDRKNNHLDDTSLIYGEVRFYSFVKLLERADPKPEDIFYDLGSGGGKAVMIAGLVFDFKAVRGVEKLAGLANLSRSLVNTLPKLSKFNQLLPNKQLTIEFIHNDFLKEDIAQATLIFINATCFWGELWRDLTQKLLTTQTGTRIIIVSQSLDYLAGFELKYRDLNLMGWGLANVSLYERV